mgnify:CR=1 FL=1
MAAYTERDAADQLFFLAPDGSRSRLITSIDDPEIANRGAGTFFPASTDEVEAALTAIPAEFLTGLNVEIFVLPFPRSGQLASSATDGAIFLSPGVRQLEPRHVHFLVAHEIGHAVHRRFMPDEDHVGWSRYAALRGIDDAARFNEQATHAFRPHEIFAEDFRVLFGGSTARGDGTVENVAISAPETVGGLRGFFTALTGSLGPSLASKLELAPNPVRPGGLVRLGRLGGDRGTIEQVELIDVAGRSLAPLAATREGSAEATIQLPTSDRHGRTLATGAYWLRVSLSDGSVSSVPLRVVR